MKIGSAKYGGGKKNFKIKDGDNIYGILPPMGELADKGKWSMYYRVEWGYKDLAGKLKPFQDVRVVNHNSKMVEIESAAHLYREQLAVNKESLVALFKAGQASQEQVKEATELAKQYNLDCKHYVNAITPTGEIGLLKIGHKAKIALDAAIKNLRAQGIEPIGLTGVFFNINRFIPKNAAGRDMPLDTTYTITPYSENVQANINGQLQLVQQRKHYQLDDSIINRLGDEAYELGSLYPVVTAEDVERFVREGAVAVDQVLGKTAVPTEDEDVPTTKPQAQQPVVTQPVVSQPVVSQPVVTQPVSEPVVTQPEIQPTPDSMSNDDFLRSIGAM
jgi:hypothetical protein